MFITTSSVHYDPKRANTNTHTLVYTTTHTQKNKCIDSNFKIIINKKMSFIRITICTSDQKLKSELRGGARASDAPETLANSARGGNASLPFGAVGFTSRDS